MGYTNFPNGITSMGMPVVGGAVLTTGNVFFVDSVTGLNGNSGKDKDHPFATIDYAIGRCTANKGDYIVIMPNHTEDIAAAGGITLDIAGVTLLGLGTGTTRPTITFSETDSTFIISAADCTLFNMVFEAAVAEVVAGIAMSGDADGTVFDSIESYEGAAAGTYNFVDFTTIATGANNLTWRNCKFIGNDTNNDAFISGVAHDGFYMDNCYFASNVAQAAVHGLVVSSGNVTNAVITNCYFRSNIDGALWIDFDGAANSGLVANCYVSSIDTAGATSTGDFTGGHFFECYVSGDADAFGLVGGGGVVYTN